MLRESLNRTNGYICEEIQEEGVGMREMLNTSKGREAKTLIKNFVQTGGQRGERRDNLNFIWLNYAHEGTLKVHGSR